ncbi:MAG: hypothetical protein COZ11_05520 [Deltaproteobacteria bacterium CG_4_10_14_3_um_filter_51_14]|nr:MAG: hypothetical protein COZ11_05520 [Deltaproteobacteria bacterium CG_4_10_14_3_um_filter_51_14]PJB38065.1 MAG: hypothetical protein CO107_03050 [Deltaproteobacteria bacterium CG_4_9_14_3_um_filter_51_14]
MAGNAGQGRGQGSGRGQGAGRGQDTSGRGRGMGGGRGMGPGGDCVCPACNEKVPHTRGVPCFEMKCPKCGAALTRG